MRANDEAMRALEGLTTGISSEFAGNVAACVNNIRMDREIDRGHVKRFMLEAQHFRDENTALRAELEAERRMREEAVRALEEITANACPDQNEGDHVWCDWEQTRIAREALERIKGEG